VVASGGAGKLEHFYDAVEAGATILLAASVFHFNFISIPDLKAYLKDRGVPVLSFYFACDDRTLETLSMSAAVTFY